MLVVDQAGWHLSERLIILANITSAYRPVLVNKSGSRVGPAMVMAPDVIGRSPVQKLATEGSLCGYSSVTRRAGRVSN